MITVFAIALFVLFFLAPATLLMQRLTRDVTAAAAFVVLLLVPWFFLRKAAGTHAWMLDLAACIGLTAAAWTLRQRDRRREAETGVAAFEWRAPALFLTVLAILFSVVWLGYEVPVGGEVRYYGLFAVDFGNLVSVISTLRASPTLPLSYVAGSGPLSYHWLYFTMPATLADFAGAEMPNGVALILTNFLVASLLFFALMRRAGAAAASVVLLAPFSLYAWQIASARLGLAEPTRNYLLLSPVNSMTVFGNNTLALALAVVAFSLLDRWNTDGRVRDAFLAALALSAIAGCSITLAFPIAVALLVWMLLGRLRRPLLFIPVAAAVGAVILGILIAIGILGGDSTRRIAFAFDGVQFLRTAFFGMLPLWGLAIFARVRLRFEHLLVAACVAVPTFLYLEGSPTGHIDFSMKTASLMAVAFAPLIVVRRTLLAVLLVALGVAHTAAYAGQFAVYRYKGEGRGEAIPRDYHRALVWIRENTPRDAIVEDAYAVPIDTVLYTTMVGERRVSMETRYTSRFLIGGTRIASVQPQYVVGRGVIRGRRMASFGEWTVSRLK